MPSGDASEEYKPTAEVVKETEAAGKIDGPAAAAKKDAAAGEKRKAEDEVEKEGKGDKEAKKAEAE